jgi:hypothetical protein
MSQVADSKLQATHNTPYTSRITHHASRITLHASPYLDFLIGLTLFLAGLYAYTFTLAPTVLEGDAALYAYTPYVLGVTYPTGYPLYILLGKLWLTLFPFGEMAWRMNLFSALCSAAALPLIYGATRRLLTFPNFPTQDEKTREEHTLLPTGLYGPLRSYSLLPRIAALAAVLTFATLPTFWRWSTEAKIYSLNILLFSSVLYTLALAYTSSQAIRNTQHVFRLPSSVFLLLLSAFLLGLQIGVHSTSVLLIPGVLLFVWLHFRSQLSDKKFLISYFLFLILPSLLYLYIPLRAEGLIAQYGRDEAIAHGLLADFYHSGWAGWLRYFTAADFTSGVVTNWGLVPQQFLTVYLPLLRDEVNLLGIGLGIIGGLALAITRPHLFWPLFLIYAMPIPFVLTYGQGEQSAFLLPSFLIFSIFMGNALILIEQILSKFHASPISPQGAFGSAQPPLGTHHASERSLPLGRFIPLLLFLVLIPTLFLPQIRYNLNWLKAKWDRAIYDEWADALAHPLEPEAAVLAHWGDLTSFWYMQYAEDRRPDLRGLYPPTEEIVANYLQTGRALYIAGPLQDWVAGIEDRYQLIPWGRLVRIAPKTVDPHTLLPALLHPSEAVFDQKLRLLGADFAPQAIDGRPYGVTLTWQALTELPPETTISVRLSQGDVIAAQLDDTLVSGWFPRPNLSSGQYVLSYVPIPIPLGTLLGKYRLQLVAYTSYKHPWSLADGTTLLDLGEIELTLPPANTQPDAAPLNPTSPGYDFNGEIELADYHYSADRVGQGKGFATELLWQAQTKPADNYLLLAELVDVSGNVLRSIEHQPLSGRAPTAGWQAGQFVRDQVDFVLPASAPAGEEALRVRLSWLRPDRSKLPVRRWLLPVGENLNLNWLDVTEKEGRVFAAPAVQYPVEANLANQARLIGYNTSLAEESGLRWSRQKCMADAAACQVHFDFYWQGLSEMEALYFVFLHVVDEQGRIVAQQDKGPGKRGKEPTTSWQPGEVVADPVDLPLSPDRMPPGLYRLQIGMYLPLAEGPRLPVLDQTGQPIGDSIEIGTIEVTP